MSMIHFLLLLSLLFPGFSAPPQVEAKPPQFEVEKYQFGLLKRGPKWTPEKTPETQKIQEGHMANINRMARLGKLVAAGPMGDNGDLAGIFIFKAASLEEASALASEDPAIKAGRLVLELMDWWGQQRIGAKLQEELKAGREPKYTMTKYYLALLGKGASATASNSPAGQKLQLGHLWHLRRQLDAGKYVAAGPFAGASEWQGLCVVAAHSADEAKAVVEADPRVKAGELRMALHSWWVAKEVWP